MKKDISYITSFEVKPSMSASTMGSGDMEVLATPSMIAMMENAALLCVESMLEPGQATVGIYIETTHTRATAIGKSVEVTAVITEVDGRKISFDIVAKDDKGVIGSGKHERFIVDREKFLSRL